MRLWSVSGKPEGHIWTARGRTGCSLAKPLTEKRKTVPQNVLPRGFRDLSPSSHTASRMFTPRHGCQRPTPEHSPRRVAQSSTGWGPTRAPGLRKDDCPRRRAGGGGRGAARSHYGDLRPWFDGVSTRHTKRKSPSGGSQKTDVRPGCPALLRSGEVIPAKAPRLSPAARARRTSETPQDGSRPPQ